MYVSRLQRCLLPVTLAGILLASTPTSAEEPEDKGGVVVAIHWKKGDKITYEIKKTRREWTDGKLTKDNSSRVPIHIEVFDVTDKGYILKWNYGKVEIKDAKGADNPLLKKMLKLSESLVLLADVTSDGKMQGLRNWKDVQRQLSEGLDAIIEHLREAGMEEDFLDRMRKTMVGPMLTKKNIELYCSREIQILLMPVGQSYLPSKPVENEVLLPNPYGGKPFPGRSIMTMTKHDQKAKAATFSWKLTLDPKTTNRIFEKTVQDMAARLGKPIPEGQSLPSLSIVDEGEWVLDLKSGWAKRLKHVRNTKANNREQKEILILTRKE
ncbi:MAG: hypothetical protein JW818_16940 [Pirellulales bacterium]|nr:hypothetical protein [Pirellulales bacterium]